MRNVQIEVILLSVSDDSTAALAAPSPDEQSGHPGELSPRLAAMSDGGGISLASPYLLVTAIRRQ